jgi:hypothetical protein
VKRLFCGILLSLAMSASALAFEAGDWVLGRWDNGEYWYPGVVQSSTRGSVVILYDDGDRATEPASRVKPYDWRVGTPVECDWEGRGEWYSGVIARLDGSNLRINYDDGDTEQTTTGRCRSE